MNNIVLDASALLALIQNERGSEIIKPLLPYSVMSTVNITEVLTALKHTNINSGETLTLITDFIAVIIPFDLEQAEYAVELQAYTQHKGLSLGDRACIALGVKLNTAIYTADKIWSELKIKDANIKLIR